MTSQPGPLPAYAVVKAQLGQEPPPRKRRNGFWKALWWLVFLVGVAYFLLPLVGTFAFALKDKPFGHAFTSLPENQLFVSTLLFSGLLGVITIIISTALVVPTAFWVRLRLPRLRPVVEFVTLLPFVVPPIVLVFGLIGTYAPPPLSITGTEVGSIALTVAAYVVLSLPYMYRAVDTGLGAIDVRSLTEAAQSLGSGWFTIIWRVILPNVRVAVLSGAFLTLAIVLGEFTIATFLLPADRAFAPFLGLLGNADPFQQAAAALISFGLTWIAMLLIAYIGRGSQSRVTLGGAR